jgi:hypothetical protein
MVNIDLMLAEMICQQQNLNLSEMKETMYKFYKDYQAVRLADPHCVFEEEWTECFLDFLDLQTTPQDQISRDDGNADADCVNGKVQNNTDEDDHEKLFKGVTDNDYENFLKDGNRFFIL